MCHLILVNTMQVQDMDPTLGALVAPPPVLADPPWRCFHVRVITGVEVHQLDVAEARLDRVVIWAAFGQCDPMPLQAAHLAARLD